MRSPDYVSTTNPCKQCPPLGAALALRGIENAVPFLHGSQGCATYMRRYVISHFREPMDIASSSLSEKNAIFGGGPNLKQGLLNVRDKYGARLVGVATTCLTETIGDDVKNILHEFDREFGAEVHMDIVPISTPSYNGSHMDGWHGAVYEVVRHLALGETKGADVNLLPGFVSPADIRHLKALAAEFGLQVTMLPDISETLDGPALEDDQRLPDGGTPIKAIRAMGGAKMTIECGLVGNKRPSVGAYLKNRFGVPFRRIGLPIGLRATDALMDAFSRVSSRLFPKSIQLERGRLVDAYVDAHKYLSGLKAAVFGEEDLVVGLCGFLAEIGVRPILAASGGKSGGFSKAVTQAVSDLSPLAPMVMEGSDFYGIREAVGENPPDILIGNSKGYLISREFDLPLIRTGFPVHDRFGAQRLLHVGYQGAGTLLDRIVNTVLERRQTDSEVGYSYL